ncbi:MAG: alpha/beta hydrolase [Gemmatimonadota bacterium]|nr:alpha/beta hydrolase [Gemmatimonadota bacterium]
MTAPAPPTSAARQLGRLATLVVAAVLVLLSAMVLVPPFNMTLFPLAVGASEYSPLLVIADLLWCLPVNRILRPRRGLRYATLAALFLSACVAVRPLTQYTRVATAASEQLGTEAAPPRFSLMAAVAGLPTNADVTQRTIGYAAADGERLTMRLYAMPGHTAHPTVVVLYGGAWRTGSADQADNVSRALASEGYTIAALDYRHAPASQYPAQSDDVNRGMALLQDSAGAWGIDLTRVAILGRSSGGHLAELAAFVPHGFPFRALIAIYAPYDLVEGFNNLPSPNPIGVREVLTSFMGGTPEQRLVQYRAASPSAYVRAGLPPTLLLFGGRDHIVKPEFNRQDAQALRAAHVPVIAVELPWAEHGFDLAPAGLGGQLAFNVMSDFLALQLKPVASDRGR